MPTFFFDQLTQRLPRILEPRYESLRFENGDLIPTETDLVPGARELAYERFSEFGDADLMGDAATNIPVVDISLDEDRYGVYMAAAGFPISFQEERAYDNRRSLGRGSDNFDRFDRRMAAARKVISQRINRFTAFGKPNLGMRGFVNNPLVTTVTASPGAPVGTATYTQLCDYFVAQIESITDNFVSQEPTTMLVSTTVNRRLGIQNPNGTKSVRQFLSDEYPNLEIIKIREVSNASLTNSLLGGLTTGAAPTNAVTIPANHDRIIIYPSDAQIVHRHIESSVAQLLPEEYLRVDGLRKIYGMFSCFTPCIIDYPQDVLYVNIPVA